MRIDLPAIWAFVKRPEMLLTLTYCGAFLCLGLLLAGLGPSLPTLGRNTNSADTRMGATVTSRALGYLAGSTSGPIFHRLPGNKMVALSLTTTAIVCFLVPHLTNFYLLCSLFFFQGVSMGMLDTGCNLMTLWLHREKCDPYIQSLHAAFAVGAVISPAVIKAFLSAQQPINLAWYGIGVAFLPFIISLLYFKSPTEPHDEDETDFKPSEIGIDSAYTVNSIEMAKLDNGISHTMNGQREWRETGNGNGALDEHEDSKAQVETMPDDAATVVAPPRPKTPPTFAFSWENRYTTDYKPYLIVLSVAIFLLFYVGGEVATGSFMTTFALRRGLTTEDGGAFLTFLFWLTFAIGRLLAIPLSLYVSPKSMLVVDLVGTFISTCFVWTFKDRYTGFAVSLIFYGFFMASTFPTAITLLQNIIPVTGNMTTVFIIGASFGEMLVPLLVSSNFEATKYMSLIYVQFASVIMGSIFMIIVAILGHYILAQREIQKKLEERIQRSQINPSIADTNIPLDEGPIYPDPFTNGATRHTESNKKEDMVKLDL